MMNYEEATVPNKNINKTIIFTNSTKHKSFNMLATQKQPQELTAKSFPKHESPQQMFGTNNTLMDSANKPTTSKNEDTNNFRFNFRAEIADTNPRKRDNENGFDKIHTSDTISHTTEHESTTELKKFANIDMNTIYPKRLSDISPKFGIQQRLNGIWYCLICDVTLLTFRTLKRHATSTKHVNLSEEKRSELKTYVDFWASQPDDCKKYQIAFNIDRVDGASLQCSCCSDSVRQGEYINHVRVCKSKINAKQKVKVDKLKSDSLVVSGSATEATETADECTIDPATNQQENIKETPPKRVHNIQTHGASTKWSTIIAGVSTRYDRHKRFFRKCSKDLILCTSCEITFDLDIARLFAHLSSMDHSRKSNMYKPYWTYTCQICAVECNSESEFWSHVNLDDGHDAMVREMVENQRDLLKEYECRGCKVVMFAEFQSVLKHLAGPVFKRKRTNVIPIPTELDRDFLDLFTTRAHIDSLAFDLLNNANEVSKLDYQLTTIINDLENTLRYKFPTVKAYPFGSRVTGLCNKTSDLDLYTDIGSYYYGDRTLHTTTALIDVKLVLADKKHLWDDIFIIAGARTPIIQLKHIPTDIDVDLSFLNGLSLENTKFLKCCMDLQPKLRSVIILLKLWNSVTKNKPHVTTYALCMLAIFKMQMDGYLIPVMYLRQLNVNQSPESKPKRISGWDIIDYELTVEQLQKYTEPVACDVFELVKDFFGYYATFDYNKMICPLLGEVVNMNDWHDDNVSILPDEMSTYKNKVTNGLIPHTIYGYRFAVTLQDPFDMSHNLMKHIKKPNLNVWTTYCQLTHDYLTKL